MSVSLEAYVMPSGESIALLPIDSTTGLPSITSALVLNVSYQLRVSAASGTYTISFKGQTTTPLQPYANAATVLAALIALSTIGAGNITVTGSDSLTITFIGALAASSQPPLTIDSSGLSGTRPAPTLTPGTGAQVTVNPPAKLPDASFTGPNWAGISPIGSGPGYQVTATGTGNNSAEYLITVPTAGNYTIYQQIPGFTAPGSSYASSTLFIVSDAGVPRGEIPIDQSSPPPGLNFNGATFIACPIGTFYCSSLTLRVVISDRVKTADIGKLIYAIKLVAVPVDPSANIIILDNSNLCAVGGPGAGSIHTETGAVVYNNSQKYVYVPGTTFTDSFAGLVPGLWGLSWSYAPDATQRATLTTFQAFDGYVTAGNPASSLVTVNQRTTPTGGQTLTDSFGHSFTFRPTTSATITGGVMQTVVTAGSDATASPPVACNAGPILAKLTTASPLAVPLVASVAVLCSGPPTITRNGGSPFTLTSQIWSGPLGDGGNSKVPYWQFELPFVIGASENVAVSVSANCLNSAAGLVPQITNQACVNSVGTPILEQWDLSNPFPMKIGMNIPNSQTSSNPAGMHLNWEKNQPSIAFTGVTATKQPITYPRGLPQSIVAENYQASFGQPLNVGNTDPRGYPVCPAGVWTDQWDYDQTNCGDRIWRAVGGTQITVISENTGHATNNRRTYQVTNISPTLFTPAFTRIYQNFQLALDDNDSGRVTYSGGWNLAGNSAYWNATAHFSDGHIGSTATWNLGSPPAGTFNLRPTWVGATGQTATATWTVKENGTTIATFTASQVTSPNSGTAFDYNNVQAHYRNFSFTCGGGAITVVCSGVGDGLLVVDGMMLAMTSTLSTPLTPWKNVAIYEPGIDPDNLPSSAPFRPLTISRMPGIGAVRTMSASGANSSVIREYTDYSQQDYASHAANSGVSPVLPITKVETWADPNNWWNLPGSAQVAVLFTVDTSSYPGGSFSFASGTPADGGGFPVALSSPTAFPLDNGDSVYFAGYLNATEHDPVRMLPNQFAFAKNSVNSTKGGKIITQTTGTLGNASAFYGSFPVADAVALANKLNCDLWYNWSPLSSQDCLTKIAQYIAANLNPGLKVWSECSNEPWNFSPGFTQFGLYQSYAYANHLPNATTAYAIIASRGHEWLRAGMGARASDFRTVYNTRVGGVSDTLQPIMTYLKSQGLTMDAAAIAPYFGNTPADPTGTKLPEQAVTMGNLTVGQIHDIAEAFLQWGNYFPPIIKATKAALQDPVNGFPNAVLLGYEGGNVSLGVGGPILGISQQAQAARYHSRQVTLLNGYFNMLYKSGMGPLFCVFQWDEVPVQEGGTPYSHCYATYCGANQLPGIPDAAQDASLAGAPPAMPNLNTAVSPTGYAINAMNGFSPNLTAGSVSVNVTGQTTATLVGTSAFGGTSPYTYTYEYALSASGVPGPWVPLAPTSSTSPPATFALTGLTQNSQYFARYIVADSASNQATTSPVAFLTQSSTPPPTSVSPQAYFLQSQRSSI